MDVDVADLPRSKCCRAAGLLALALTGSLVSGCRGEGPPLVDLAEGPPSVVVIALDTFRADHLGAYGNASISTPVLDRFADEAIVFEHCSSAATWTLPSFASLFTGLLPYHHGVIGGPHGKLDDAQVTLAEILAEHGYRTYAYTSVDYLSARHGMMQGFGFIQSFLRGDVTGRVQQVRPHVEDVLRRPHRDPVLVFAHFFDAHAPYDPPAPFDGMYYEGDPRDPTHDTISVIYDQQRNRIRRDPEPFYRWLRGITDLEYPVRQYAAGVSYLDHELDSLFETMRTSGMMDRSIVIVLADHGEHLTEHDTYFTHRFPYEECLHVPLMIRLPHAVAAGRRVTTDVSLIDVLPTLLELLGLPPREPLDGLSLVDLMKGGRDLPRDYLFAEHGGRINNVVKAVWDDEYRLIHFHTGGRDWVELYDRRHDRAETEDLAGTLPRVQARLTAALDATFDPTHPLAGGEAAPEADTDPDADARLRALGYID
jgi:arylsulfatase A-like enzyme